MEEARTYLPAAGHDRALPLYDPLVRLLGFDRARQPLVEQAELRPSLQVLDIGCGTGTLAVQIKRLYPSVEVTGVDPDPRALARARRKAEQAGAAVRFDFGFSQKLPYPGAHFDRVFSSLMFHHLEPDVKRETLRQVRRVLKPGGSLHLMDFGGEEARAQGRLARLFHSNQRLKDNSEARILGLMNETGFASAEEVAVRTALFGVIRIVYYRAFAPAF